MGWFILAGIPGVGGYPVPPTEVAAFGITLVSGLFLAAVAAAGGIMWGPQS